MCTPGKTKCIHFFRKYNLKRRRISITILNMSTNHPILTAVSGHNIPNSIPANCFKSNTIRSERCIATQRNISKINDGSLVQSRFTGIINLCSQSSINFIQK